MNNILELRHIQMRFGGVVAVSALDLQIGRGQIAAIIGPNGAGKTTAFNIITGIYTPTAGQVLYCGGPDGQPIDITGQRADRIVRLGIARTFQNIRLFAEQTVLDNVLLGQHVHVKSGFLGAISCCPGYYREEQAMREYAMELLEEIGIADLADADAVSLPYGIQRRLEIARALASRPKLLLLDEPAAGMNPQETLELADFIREIRDKYHVSILLIEHHMDLVMEIVENIYVLDFGKLIAQGKPEQIQNDPLVISAYLGVGGDE